MRSPLNRVEANELSANKFYVLLSSFDGKVEAHVGRRGRYGMQFVWKMEQATPSVAFFILIRGNAILAVFIDFSFS